MSETPKEATNPNPQAPTSSRGLEQMTTQASNISLSDPKDCGTDIDTSTPHRPATDILSRLPLEITFQVLEQLSDKEKIKATRVCKSWESIAKTWQKENCQTILKKYGPIIDSPKFGWTKFRNAVKLAHIKPSSTPSGKLTHDSSNVHFVNSKKYAAWMNGKGFVTARLRPTTSVKPGESRTENETSYKLSTLLGCSNAQIFGEILSVEDSGCVLVAVGRYLKAPKKNGPKPEHCEKAIVGFFCFDINEERIVWTTDRDGNAINSSDITEETIFDTYFVVNYTTQSTLFSEGLLIKATAEVATRSFALWYLNSRTGTQHCIVNNLVYFAEQEESEVPAEKDAEPIIERFEPRREEINKIKPESYRPNYKADQFDIKMLPFCDSKETPVYAAISWSHDWTYPMFNPSKFLDQDTGKPRDYNGLASSMGPTIRQLVDLGVNFNPIGQISDGFLQNSDILRNPANQNLMLNGAESFLDAWNLAQLGFSRGDGPLPSFHAELLIVNIATHEVAYDTLNLPAFRTPYIDLPSEDNSLNVQPGDYLSNRAFTAAQKLRRDAAFKKWGDWHGSGAVGKAENIWSQEIGDLVNGQCGTQVRYPLGMQVYTRDVITETESDSQAGSECESVTLDIVLYTGLQRYVTFLIPPYSPYKTPEAWTVTVNRTVNSDGSSSFNFTNLTSSLYSTIFRRVTPAPPKLVVNPLFDIVLDNADAPCFERDEAALWKRNMTPERWDRENAALLAEVPENIDCVAEIYEYEEVKEKRRVVVDPEDEENTWTMRWMKCKAKRGIYEPVGDWVDVDEEGGEKRIRLGWKSRFGLVARTSEPEPMEIGENGVKFGGLWVWN